jgi:hypothetical protein
MRIILDVQQTTGGRLQGTGRTEGSMPGQPFEGIIELIALLETYLQHTQTLGDQHHKNKE